MARTQSPLVLRGRLQLVVDGHAEPIDLGELELPLNVEFKRPPAVGGGAMRGGGIAGPVTINMPSSGPGADLPAVGVLAHRGLASRIRQ